MSFIPFSLPDISDTDISAVVDALRSGWITTGPKAAQFEYDFSSFLGGDLEAVAVNSATAGLHLGLEAMGVGPGDEVITTTHTFTATAEVIRYLGATPVFVDIDPSTYCIDLDAVSRSISPRTKVIIPVHFAGLAVNMHRLESIAKPNGIRVLEDAAHALPATYNGQLIGTFDSEATVFSFYANKTMTTGEGGMLVTQDKELASRARRMRLHGINRDVFDRFTSRMPSWQYEVVAPGFKYNMTDIAAALGIQQLKRVESLRKRREEIALYYNERLQSLPIRLPPLPQLGDIHSWHLYVIKLDPDITTSRNHFIDLMFRGEVGCSVHYIPLHLHPYWRDAFALQPHMFPVSQAVYEQSVSLPIYNKMSDADVEKVISTAIRILSQ